MPDRQIDYGEDETDATYRSGDAGGTDGGGNFVVAELLGDRVLMEWDQTADEWVVRGPVDMDGRDVSNVGDVESVSLSNQDYNESVETHATASGTVTIDLSLANVHHVEAVDNVTIEFAGVTATPAGNSVVIYVTDDDGTGPHTISWPASVVWDGGDVVGEVGASSDVEASLLSGDGGTEWRGRLSGEDFE